MATTALPLAVESALVVAEDDWLLQSTHGHTESLSEADLDLYWGDVCATTTTTTHDLAYESSPTLEADGRNVVLPTPTPTSSENQDPQSQQSTEAAAAKAKEQSRVKRRQAQNRIAQQAFRERREKRTRELTDELATLNERYAALEAENQRLKKALMLAKKEIKAVRPSAAEGATSSSPSGESVSVAELDEVQWPPAQAHRPSVVSRESLAYGEGGERTIVLKICIEGPASSRREKIQIA